MFESGWATAQAETQFQGTGSSHELAALLLTETIKVFHLLPKAATILHFTRRYERL